MQILASAVGLERGFSPDGTRTVGFQSGTWEKIGNHKWSLKMTGKDSKSGGGLY